MASEQSGDLKSSGCARANLSRSIGRFAAVVFLMLIWTGARAEAGVYHREKVKLEGVASLTYFIARPEVIEEGRAYPTIIVFLGGKQTTYWANVMAKSRLAEIATERGYILIIPAAPGGKLFFRSGERAFPAFFEHIKTKVPVAGGKFHLMGLSNGGITSFHIGAGYADYVLSITSFPGFLHEPSEDRYRALSSICISMYVGERDIFFARQQKQTVEALAAMGKDVFSHVFPGDEHDIAALHGDNSARLLDGIEQGLGC